MGYAGIYLLFLFLIQNIDCGYKLGPPWHGGSNEYPQSMFWITYMKNEYPCTPQVYYIKVGFTAVYNSCTCFPDVCISLVNAECHEQDHYCTGHDALDNERLLPFIPSTTNHHSCYLYIESFISLSDREQFIKQRLQ